MIVYQGWQGQSMRGGVMVHRGTNTTSIHPVHVNVKLTAKVEFLQAGWAHNMASVLLGIKMHL